MSGKKSKKAKEEIKESDRVPYPHFPTPLNVSNTVSCSSLFVGILLSMVALLLLGCPMETQWIISFISSALQGGADVVLVATCLCFAG